MPGGGGSLDRVGGTADTNRGRSGANIKEVDVLWSLRVSFVSVGCHIFATLTHLVLITVDRYIAVKKPLRYRDIVTTQRVICGVLSVWGFTIYVTIQESILAAVNRASDIYNNVSFSTLTTVGLICIVFIVGIYLYIFSETRRQQRTQTEHLLSRRNKNYQEK